MDSGVQTLAARARAALQAGRDAEAVDLIRRALAVDAEVPQLHADLAVALQNLGDNAAAAAAARRALELQPHDLSALNTLGNALRALGELEPAIQCFRRATVLGPHVALLHLNLASALREAGRAEEAVDAYAPALRLQPDSADLQLLVGSLLRTLRRPDEAASHVHRAIALRPSFAEAHNVLGNLLFDAGRAEEAVRCYRRALAVKPAYVEARFNLGNALRATGQPEAALEAYGEAAALRPDFTAAHLGRGRACAELERHDEAAAHFSRALAAAPELAEGWCGLGNALRALGRPDEAAAAYRHAVAIMPDLAEAHCNWSTACLDLGELEPAIDHARRALAVEPRLADAHFNLAQAYLTGGDLARGWREYEHRGLRRGMRELDFPQPPWQGEPLGERTVLVTAEQGVGDEIMFASCLPDLLRVAGRCVVECDARLVPLFARSFAAAAILPRLRSAADYPADRPAPDCRVATGSLPRFFRDDLDRFPTPAAYLHPDPPRVEEWRARFAALGDGLKVGISWRGGKDPQVRRARSIPLDAWARLASVRGLHLIDLQYGDTADERRLAREDTGLRIHHWDDADPLADLDGLAAQIAALDLVLSVDNATVHLAGALGVPTWAMLPRVADWRWMTDREDTPWYPRVRLFRQGRAGVWAEVLDRVAGELGRMAAGHRLEAPPAAAPRTPVARSRPWAALLNDTTHWYHWGCTCTSTAIVRALVSRGYGVGQVPISGLQACARAPAFEAFDDPATFRRYLQAHEWLARELEGADRVVINGEGSLHGDGEHALKLLYLAYAARVHLGRPVQIVNHSCYPAAAGEPVDSPVWRTYLRVYQAIDYVAIREPVSHRLITGAGIPAVASCDCLPLFVARHYRRSEVRRREGIVIAGSVALREADLERWADFADRMARRGARVEFLLGASLFPAPEEQAFAEALRERAAGSLEVRVAEDAAAWLDAIAGAGALVSGRFHHTLAAASLGTPFVLLGSNTSKNAGLAELLGAPAPLGLDAPELAAELAARAEAALAAPAGDGGMADLQRLCAMAMKNFDALPPVEDEVPAAARSGGETASR